MNEERINLIKIELEEDIKSSQELIRYFEEKLKDPNITSQSNATKRILSYKDIYKEEENDFRKYGNSSTETLAIVCMEKAVIQEKENIIDKLYEILKNQEKESNLLKFINELEDSI